MGMVRTGRFVLVVVIGAMLVWRELAVERKLEVLIAQDVARQEQAAKQRVADLSRVSQRDAAIDEALWALFGGQPAEAIGMVKALQGMQAPTPLPPNARSIEDAARCVLGEKPAAGDWPPGRGRVRAFCDFQRAVASR
jgi:hypothetical protein